MGRKETFASITLKMWVVSLYLTAYGFSAIIVGPLGILLCVIMTPFAIVSAIVNRGKSNGI